MDVHQLLRLGSKLTLALTLASMAIACGDGDNGDPDAGVTPADSGQIGQDAFVLPDVPNPDAAPRADTGPSDAGHFCVMNDQVEIEGTNVSVDPATAETENPATGQASVLNSCIDRRPTQVIGAPLRYRGCLRFVGGAPTQQELDQLEITVFRELDGNGDRIDPSYDRQTGQDRAAAQRIATDVLKVAVDPQVCPSGWQLLLGANSLGANGLVTDLAYVIRFRTSTTSGANTWLDTYYFGMDIRADQLEAGSSPTDICTPQTCSGRFDAVVFRQSGVSALITASGANIPGAADLTDGEGSGHALLQTFDCQDLPMEGAGGGFEPAPTAASYLTGGYGWSSASTNTSSAAALLGLGFTGTSSTAGINVRGAVTVNRDGTCSEQFAGRAVMVFPDAISVVRSARDNTIN